MEGEMQILEDWSVISHFKRLGFAEWVKEVNESAQIPFTRVVEALDLTQQ
jgi:hypothetical protein